MCIHRCTSLHMLVCTHTCGCRVCVCVRSVSLGHPNTVALPTPISQSPVFSTRVQWGRHKHQSCRGAVAKNLAQDLAPSRYPVDGTFPFTVNQRFLWVIPREPFAMICLSTFSLSPPLSGQLKAGARISHSLEFSQN